MKDGEKSAQKKLKNASQNQIQIRRAPRRTARIDEIRNSKQSDPAVQLAAGQTLARTQKVRSPTVDDQNPRKWSEKVEHVERRSESLRFEV